MPSLNAADIRRRAATLQPLLSPCRLCPRECKVDRSAGEKGFCQTGAAALVASFGPHFGEERPLVGRGGSGTVFFAGCNMGCIFCQNDDISHGARGRAVTIEHLATLFLEVQKLGCHNLNLVTPSHVVPQILEALALAVEEGFALPIVYNTGGYDRADVLKQLDGIVDIYMPDYKFTDPDVATQLAGARDYPAVAQAALREMHRQVGDLVIDEKGVAQRGLLVRHLVMPFGTAGTEAAFRFLAEELSRDTYLNIMAQYRPCHRAHEVDRISRPVSATDVARAYQLAGQFGLHRLDER
ncbi:MAG: hypothetical protein P9L99_02445 [Candidatus Lernaella stagnicola]|nr:hypothetical protein [Candidatus Lernaella stagnicola]